MDAGEQAPYTAGRHWSRGWLKQGYSYHHKVIRRLLLPKPDTTRGGPWEHVMGSDELKHAVLAWEQAVGIACNTYRNNRLRTWRDAFFGAGAGAGVLTIVAAISVSASTWVIIAALVASALGILLGLIFCMGPLLDRLGVHLARRDLISALGREFEWLDVATIDQIGGQLGGYSPQELTSIMSRSVTNYSQREQDRARQVVSGMLGDAGMATETGASITKIAVAASRAGTSTRTAERA